jgi:hypothetical protein
VSPATRKATRNRFFTNADFRFGVEIALGATYRGAADVGEALVTVARITDDDADSWLDEWTATAAALWAAAGESSGAGRRAGALSHFRRAATYYATALYVIAATPVVVVNDGSDGATSQTWVQGGAAAAERGDHFDDLRRSRPAGRPARAGHPVPAGLGGRADAGRPTRWWRGPTSTPGAWR